MARPTKQGLDYFSMDVEKDNKLKFVKAKFGLVGFATYIELLQFVYKEGYYIEFDDDNMLLFMSETGLKEEETKLMLEFMLEKGLFIKDLYNKYKVLTSSGIQKRYAEGTKKRKNTSVYKGFWVAGDYEHIELMDTLTGLKEEETELKEEESTQSKVKESKEKEELENYREKRNKNSGDFGRPKCIKITKELEAEYKKIKKDFSYEEIIIATTNYAKEIRGRDEKSSYSKHRFSFFEFLSQKNGLRNFINK